MFYTVTSSCPNYYIFTIISFQIWDTFYIVKLQSFSALVSVLFFILFFYDFLYIPHLFKEIPILSRNVKFSRLISVGL